MRRYFKRLWCAIAHQDWWEFDARNDVDQCRKCGEAHDAVWWG